MILHEQLRGVKAIPVGRLGVGEATGFEAGGGEVLGRCRRRARSGDVAGGLRLHLLPVAWFVDVLGWFLEAPPKVLGECVRILALVGLLGLLALALCGCS